MKISGVTNIDGHLTFGNAEALYEEKSISITFKQKQSLEIQNDMENSLEQIEDLIKQSLSNILPNEGEVSIDN